MGLLSKAAEKAAAQAPAKGRSKGTIWEVNEDLDLSVGKVVDLSSEIGTLEAQMSVHKERLIDFGLERWCDFYAANSVHPETPMSLRNANGTQVVFSLADRTGQYKVAEAQKKALVSLLGKDADDITCTRTSFKLNDDVLNKPGVSEAIEKALEECVAKLVKERKLAKTDELIVAESRETFVPKIADRLHNFVGSNKDKLLQLMHIVGSSITRTVKA